MKIIFLLLFVFTFSFSDCGYSCLPTSTQNAVETVTSNQYDALGRYYGNAPDSYQTETCSGNLYQIIEHTFTQDGEYYVANENQITYTCHFSALNEFYDPDTGQNRPLTPDDCSASQYFESNSGTCQNADCPVGQVPDADYANTATCHPDSQDGNDNGTDTNSSTDNSSDTGTGTSNGSADTGNNGTNSDTNNSTNSSDNSNYTDILNNINSNISQLDTDILVSLSTISSDISMTSQTNHNDLLTLNSSVDNFSVTNHNDLSSISTKIDHTNASLSIMNDFMQSGMNNTEASDSLTNAQNQATSTVNSITNSLNGIISSYTGSSPIVTGTGTHIFSTPPIYGKSITFDLSMFQNLRQYFDVLWLLMLAYFNFKMYVLIIRDLLKKF